MPEPVSLMLRERFGVTYNEAYGLTESAAFLHANPPERTKHGCIGIPTIGVSSRVIDPDTGVDVPQGSVGEIVSHGGQIMLGYWNRPDANAQAFIHIDGRAYFRTGDLGFADADGYYFLVDRLKRMINASGYKVWPAEVEAVLHQHPDIHEACVIAVPDAKRGETVKAVVVPKAGHEAVLDAMKLEKWCRTKMAAYKVPRLVEFVSSLPRSSIGKVLWRELQNRELIRASATDGDNNAPDTAKTR